MLNWSRGHILRALKVPAQPTPPLGAPGSVRIFRASPNFYKILCIGWGFAQIGAVIGIIFSLWFLQGVNQAIANHRSVPPAQVQPLAETPAVGANDPETTAQPRQQARKVKRTAEQKFAALISGWPWWTMLIIQWGEYAAIATFLIQIPITLAAVRLEYEQHWYIVTDRSLRIRTGLFTIQETTMSFANLQQVEIKQGPLQRVLGISDVRVQSAGGGGGENQGKGSRADSMHSGVFHGVNNAGEIRDLILLRLRHFRESGLGDPDDNSTTRASPAHEDATLAATRELLAEARLLGQSLKT